MKDDQERGPGGPDHRVDRIPLHERIRNLRHKLGITGYELAERAEISPSYVSLIEKGLKVPNEDVAIRLARVLGDDEDLYAAWARSARHGDLRGARNAVETAAMVSSDPGLRRRIARGDRVDLESEAEDLARLSFRDRSSVPLASPPRLAPPSFFALREDSTVSPAARRAADGSAEVLYIPILRAGADPGPEDAPADPATADRLPIDARLLPPEDREHAFAYRIVGGEIERVRDRIEPGSVVVISRRLRAPSAERIHAVRFHGTVVLSRTLHKGNLLLLLPPEGRSDIREVELRGLGGLRDVLVGSVVLTLRRW